jgi:hypothetical protein
MTRRTLLLPLLLTVLCLLASASVARAQSGDHRAGLVIRYADGSVQTQCVAFSEPSITGEELLQRSGLAVTLDYNAGLGGAVCSINNQGCAYPIKDCFCKCTGIQCEYWAYYHRTAAGWQYASSGASSFLVNDGALEGWSWGAGNFSSGVEPPLVAFNEVCAPPATATPTATATATASATPAATATSTPSATVRPPQDQTPPQVVLEANATEVSPGACTLLRWWVTGATELTLNGAPVSAQDQRQVCPSATQRFTLTATNAAGQTVRELTVTIAANPTAQASVQPGPTATHTPTASATNTPSATPGRAVVLAPTIVPTLPIATVTVAPTSLAQPPAATPEPPLLGLAGIAVAHAQEIAPTAAPNSQISHGLSPETVSLLVAGATATPRPRRQLGADGRPTPTPILLAYAPPADSSGRSDARTRGLSGDSTASTFEAPSRDFSLALLPGYAAYFLTLASLVGAGVWVVRRKSGALRKS